MASFRENLPHYIGTSDADIKQMLEYLGLEKLEDLYSHIENDHKLSQMNLPMSISHKNIKEDMESLSKKNNLKLNLIGDGLFDYSVSEIVPKVCNIRGLTTAYTPYQPERSQGTLQTLWIYQSALASITGFEAVNASFYERATCLFEAINCAKRIKRKVNKALVAKNLYPGDIEVLETIKKHTELEIEYLDIDPATGKINLDTLKEKINSNEYASFTFSQIGTFGIIEDFDEITKICKNKGLLTIGVIDPVAISNNGLKEPSAWGQTGVDMIVAEGQHLTIGPNFGGPGLGIFAIRFNKDNKTGIRNTAGRYIGKTVDSNGNECKSIILSTREQHIRREKATSNICSNQSFVASACGASLLNRGDEGLAKMFETAHENAKDLARELSLFEGIELAFNGAFFNEVTLKTNKSVDELINLASNEGIAVGINVSKRAGQKDNLLKITTTDRQSKRDLSSVVSFFAKHFKKGSISEIINEIPSTQKRVKNYSIPAFSTDDLDNYYQRLGKQNLSPDEGIYPLGSCTMKYNPEINDWAASLPGFTDTHPQALEKDVQGNLELLFEIQNWFKQITGLPAVTTQPVAGAQGELVGLKMFQDYHADNGQKDSRNIVLIPRSAHGTNPATATMAGYQTKKVGDITYGIVTIDADETGKMNFAQMSELIDKHGKSIAAVMVTNPNTAGIFETDFAKMSKKIHDVGGLVYMDGANMNAIAGWIDLQKIGVDAVHNNLHKTWSIPHGGGGPGDAIVAVSEKLIDYMPGVQILKDSDKYYTQKPLTSIGSFHRHYGNFAHKVRTLTYLKALGHDGIKKMSAVSVLSARYLYKKLRSTYPILPAHSEDTPRMHEFILTLPDDVFERAIEKGTPKSAVIAKVGKLFLDFGFHAPTVAFPEVYGLMLEPTESYSKSELDGFCEVVETIYKMVSEYPEILTTTPHFTPVRKVDEVKANKDLILSEKIEPKLASILEDKVAPDLLRNMGQSEIIQKILEAHKSEV
ncbi:MAG: aminomethyl-transferring glycine dehydrogenase subunit GcvPB [Bacteriovoracaceae bacterium]|nr:aminomethyl-transferring glycine dehydrogenase subunit GcvPB [Bacteriovoracaceae bacterium]